MARIVIVPGLAVRSYARPAAAALRRRGHTVSLLRAPAWRRTPASIDKYGELLARQLQQRGEHIDLLIGLSVGSQAAATAAANCSVVAKLLLVSATVDFDKRTHQKLLSAWLFGNKGDDGSPLSQLPDWAHAGLFRILAGFRSTLQTPIETTLEKVSAKVTIVHAGKDSLSSESFAATLARYHGGTLIVLPNASHSWPVGDTKGFVQLVTSLTTTPRT